MFEWALSSAWKFGWRIAVTLGCIWTLQNIVHQEGYLIPFNILLVGAVALIVGVGVWTSLFNKYQS